MFENPNETNISKAISFCINKNAGSFIDSELKWTTFAIPSKYDIPLTLTFHEYVTTIDLNNISNQLPIWYSILGHCRTFFILNESFYSLLKDILYENLPDICKKLLSGNIKKLKKKCDLTVA